MYFLDQIKKNIADLVNEAVGQDLVRPTDLVYPPNEEMGDLSLACFDLAGQLSAKGKKQSPMQLAQNLVGQVKQGQVLSGVKSSGPYLNFVLNKEDFMAGALKEIFSLSKSYGNNKDGRKKIMIEYSNVNTHKEYHAGHLRNLFYGDAITKILDANGHDVIPVSYVNDFGIHVAKTLWAFYKFNVARDLPDNKGYLLGQIYARASAELENDESNKEEVVKIMKEIESRAGQFYELWQETRQWSIEQFKKIYQDLGVEFKEYFYESDFIEKGLDMVADLYEKHILAKSQGMIVADLQPDNLGVLPILRSDGTALYPVADLPLAVMKLEKYKLDESIYVVDTRQSLYLKQLFKLLEQIGYKQKLTHLSYEFIKLPTGMMSSRTGNIIAYEDLWSEALRRAKTEIRDRHNTWSDKQVEATARLLAIGALKFEMLKVGPDKVITFDLDLALDFNGYTSAYIQYVGARINSILRKADETGLLIDKSGHGLVDIAELRLALLLSKYPAMVVKAGAEHEPAEIAKYLFELSQMFNEYYHQTPILNSDDEQLTRSRLGLLLAVKRVLSNGMSLLGIEMVSEM